MEVEYFKLTTDNGFVTVSTSCIDQIKHILHFWSFIFFNLRRFHY